jgi:hypothetical protein
MHVHRLKYRSPTKYLLHLIERNDGNEEKDQIQVRYQK